MARCLRPSVRFLSQAGVRVVVSCAWFAQANSPESAVPGEPPVETLCALPLFRKPAFPGPLGPILSQKLLAEVLPRDPSAGPGDHGLCPEAQEL